jgi:thymidylate synthase (FAD)
MKLINPFYQILDLDFGHEYLARIERAGRTCYKSEGDITGDSAEKFVAMLINRGHESVLEHEKLSVLFVCDRGVSHEIVRHRLASFSQESTRYCNYAKDRFGNELTFIIPCWLGLSEGNYLLLEDNGIYDTPDGVTTFQKLLKGGLYHYLRSLSESEISYFNLIHEGWTPQQARSVLPNSLKTEIVVTANFREWRTIFKQRTSTAAHPQMRQLMCPLLDELKKSIPVIFDDIKY